MSDQHARRYPVSVKAIVRTEKGYALLKNERDEWELPGGKLEDGEAPDICAAREIHEELGVEVTIGRIVDAWIYHVNDTDVLIVTYGVPHLVASSLCAYSHEHKALGFFAFAALPALRIPAGYVRSIAAFEQENRIEP